MSAKLPPLAEFEQAWRAARRRGPLARVRFVTRAPPLSPQKVAALEALSLTEYRVQPICSRLTTMQALHRAKLVSLRSRGGVMWRRSLTGTAALLRARLRAQRRQP